VIRNCARLGWFTWPTMGVALVVSGLSCSETTPTPTTQRNFDRPTDLTFACYGRLRITGATAPDDTQVTAQPTRACEIRSGLPTGTPPEPPVPPGQEGVNPVGWKAFILQSVPGTVMIAEFETEPPAAITGADPAGILVHDADPLSPGINGISIGEDPVAIATDRSGCFVVTANAGPAT
jgi:hypothetical protein